MDKHKPHKRLSIVPAMDLADNALCAFRGAEYHLFKMQENLDNPILNRFLAWRCGEQVDDKTAEKLKNYGLKYDWHLRGFFWELVAAFETILQWANQRYQLGLIEKQVHWENGIEKKKVVGIYQSEWDNKYQLLKIAWDSEWYFEVRMYRNFPHRTFHFIQHDVTPIENTNPVKYKINITSIPPARDRQQECIELMDQLQGYLEEMRKLGENIFSNLS